MEASIICVATCFMTLSPAKHPFTFLCNAVWTTEARQTLLIKRLTPMRITNNTPVTRLDWVPRPASPKSCTTAFSTKTGLLATCSPTVPLRLGDKLDRVGQIFETGRSSDIGLSARLSNVSSFSALGIGAYTYFSTGFNDGREIYVFRLRPRYLTRR